jgi:SAM-dependent methyltransferase
MTTISPRRPVDAALVEAFAGRLQEMFTGGALTCLLDVGRRTGLLDAAALGPATSAQLADRAGLSERYVREWLGAMVTGGIVEYEPSSGRYALPPEHAACLTGETLANLAPAVHLMVALARHVPAVADAFRTGGGVPYSAYLPELHDVMEALWGPTYDGVLVDEIIPLAPTLPRRLTAGATVAEIACGTGRALMALAAAYPASRFVGIDHEETAIDRARAGAAARGLTSLRFEVGDAAALASDAEYDAVLVFNAFHDQAAPTMVLRNVHRALVPGGTFLMDEPRVSDDLEENKANPFAPFLYAVSTLHCLSVSLAQNGAGLGAALGEGTARLMLEDAGFADVVVHDAPGDPGNAVYVAHKPTGATTDPADQTAESR